MSFLTKQQRRYLGEIKRQRTRVNHQQSLYDQARLVLDEMMRVGHENGISTYNLSKAANLSQTRVYQIVAASTPPITPIAADDTPS